MGWRVGGLQMAVWKSRAGLMGNQWEGRNLVVRKFSVKTYNAECIVGCYRCNTTGSKDVLLSSGNIQSTTSILDILQ